MSLPYTIRVTWEDDDLPLLDWLGDFTSVQPTNQAYLDLRSGYIRTVDGPDIYVGNLLGFYTYDSRYHRYYTSMNYPNPVTDDEVKWFIEDYKRLKSYGWNWHMEVCTVEIMIDGHVIAGASLSGIESDRTPEYTEEVIKDVTQMALSEVNIDDLQAWADMFSSAVEYFKEQQRESIS